MVRLERNVPAESTTWFHVALVLFASALVAASLALTQKDRVSITVGELWIVSAALLAMGVICLIAHWDANRGRKVKQSDVVEEWKEPYRPAA